MYLCLYYICVRVYVYVYLYIYIQQEIGEEKAMFCVLNFYSATVVHVYIYIYIYINLFVCVCIYVYTYIYNRKLGRKKRYSAS